MTTINDNVPRSRSTFYVNSPLKDNKINEKLLGDTPDSLAMGGLPPLLKE
jgi:hypothetical protein